MTYCCEGFKEATEYGMVTSLMNVCCFCGKILDRKELDAVRKRLGLKKIPKTQKYMNPKKDKLIHFGKRNK